MVDCTGLHASAACSSTCSHCVTTGLSSNCDEAAGPRLPRIRRPRATPAEAVGERSRDHRRDQHAGLAVDDDVTHVTDVGGDARQTSEPGFDQHAGEALGATREHHYIGGANTGDGSRSDPSTWTRPGARDPARVAISVRNGPSPATSRCASSSRAIASTATPVASPRSVLRPARPDLVAEPERLPCRGSPLRGDRSVFRRAGSRRDHTSGSSRDPVPVWRVMRAPCR